MSEIDDGLDLLPANSTPLERELARLSRYIELIDPVQIEWIWDAWRCPAPLLPWLAWALSVDFWDEEWSEIQKRQSIADSPAYHRRKGTVESVETLLALGERPYSLIEWWQQAPQGRRGTVLAHIVTELADVWGVTRRVRPLVMSSKPKSRAVFLGVGPLVDSSFVIGAGILEETLTTIDPYAYPGEEVGVDLTVGAGILEETLTTIGAAA